MIRIAVRSLIEFVLRSGDYRCEFTSPARPLEGARGHRRVQKSRPEHYRSEVAFKHTFSVEDLEIQLQGRIDGIFDEESGPVIDEIKTTYGELTHDGHDMHWAQAKFYAWIILLEQNLDRIDVQLTYLQLESNEIREIRKTFSAGELQDFYRPVLESYAEWARLRSHWENLREESAMAIEFPFGDYRKGQRELAVAVWKAIDAKNKLYIQAPTGIGKTIGTIFPAVKASSSFAKLFYLTAKTTGRAVAEKAFALLRDNGLRYKTLTLTAKEKICFMPGAACIPEECPFTVGYYDRLRGAVEDAHLFDNLDRQTVEELAKKHRICPFEFSLELSLWADAVICDYNYVFDPRVYLRRFFQDTAEPYVFLVDEAHNLPDRARSMFSASLSKKDTLQLSRTCKDYAPQLTTPLKNLNKILIDKRKQAEAIKQEAFTENEAPAEIVTLVKKYIAEAEKWLAINPKSDGKQEILDFYFHCLAFVRTSEFFDERYVTLYEKQRDELIVNLFCMDPSYLLGLAFEKSVSSIVFSATLTPLDYYMDILAAKPEDGSLLLESPFPGRNVAVLIANRIPTTYKQRENSAMEVAQMIHAAVNSRKGNYIVYFPSYRYMRQVLDFINLPETEIIVQESGTTEEERDVFLAKFSSANEKTHVGFCVMGGVFGEGIDLVGDRLIGAIIVGVGLPQINPRLDLIRDYYNHLEGSGFQYAYMFPGMGRVLQAAGRVIRTPEDKGMIFLIDERFAHQRYLQLFPELWRNWRPIGKPEEAERLLNGFWERV